VTAAELRAKLEDEHERGRRLVLDAYRQPPPAGTLREVAVPLVLDLIDTARSALNLVGRP
jgi:hypothetical protein